MLDQRETDAPVIGSGHFDITRDLVCTADARGYFLSLNAAWEKVLGWSRKELMSRPFIEFVHPDDRERTIAETERIGETDAVIVNLENRYKRQDGSWRWLRWSGRSDGELWFAVAYDVTDDREAEDRVRRALSAGGLVVYAQPILDQRSNTIVQDELLARLVGEGDAISAPDTFIPQAERNGLVKHIDYRMLRQALRAAARGRETAVNISARSMGDPGFSDAVTELLRSSPRSARRLVFEITETAVLENMDAAQQFTTRLNALGCRLALDDFGTGFASLTYLRQLPVHYLKVDSSFVHEAAREPRARNLIRGIVAMAGQFGMVTVAEGVEDAQTLELLRGCGVDRIQGYLVGRPRPISNRPFWRYEQRAAGGPLSPTAAAPAASAA